MREDRHAVSFGEFRQAIRAYRPSQFLHILARLANQIGDPPYDFSGVTRYVQPWFIALAARESVLWGNEFRDALYDERHEKALRRVLNMFADQIAGTVEQNPIQSELIRIAHEQFPYQSSVHEDIGRSHAMLVEPLADRHVISKLKVVSDDTWEDLIGAPLGQVVGATLLHWISAKQLGGRLNLDAFGTDPDMKTFLDVWPPSALKAVSNRLVTTIDGFRADYKRVHPVEPVHTRYGYNPFMKTPFIKFSGTQLPVAPQPRLILNTITPAGLYHAGVAAYGNEFATDMGHLFEHYIGRQLRLTRGVQVVGERDYGPSAARKKTVDWIVVFPDCTLLVEVKSRRLSVAATARADIDLDEHVASLITGAGHQIARSHSLIVDRAEALADIPGDRPCYGLIVTAEPIYMANGHWVRDHIPSPGVPTMHASIRDIEHLVRIPSPTLSRTLQAVMADPDLRTWELTTAFANRLPDPEDWGPNNPIIRNGWDSYPWPEGLDKSDPDDELPLT